ncbi:MAG: hypothetical protein ABH821_03720 [archaeon]
MTLKDNVLGFYVKHFLMPRAQILDKPGFIVFNVSGPNAVFARQVLIPEQFFVLLEKKVDKKILYSVGKKFGYRFALIGNFSRKGEISDGKLPEYIQMVNKFIEGTYASKIDCKIDLSIPRIEYFLDNFVVCNKTTGYFLPLGAAAGMLSYILNDSIDGKHLECESNGKSECKLEYSLSEKDFDFSCLSVSPDYLSMNSVKELLEKQLSLQKLIDASVFSFEKGILSCQNQRFFILEVSALYLLEKELPKKVLENVSFETGKFIAETLSIGSLDSLSDFLTAFGFGEVVIFKEKSKLIVNLKYFPWTKFENEVSFVFVKSLLEGTITSVQKRQVLLSLIEKNVLQGSLTLFFHEI